MLHPAAGLMSVSGQTCPPKLSSWKTHTPLLVGAWELLGAGLEAGSRWETHICLEAARLEAICCRFKAPTTGTEDAPKWPC